ncbi:glycosyltransferase family 9 protein [Hymenobacter sp. UV11]|uniref:glycosyltransferase family 9 protein n=1 Tax=Hymenobacter sp. UV11 TaxID=1849735 RepID=UPI001061DB72|nr:glycosyltransferase family 9 protein [Hymenobacter sp. UV11]TDN38349.1 glycosyl transferase [Hymenobacter sp. UV11]TFZ68054.1 glycosyltransferase family 9 protein [Hymenobacter sp. UV11]
MKILVLRFSSIGDIVLTTPVVRQLKTQLPGAQVHFATKPAFAKLFEASPYVDKLHLLSGSLGELVRELRAERFDFIVDLHNNLRTRLIRLQLPGVPGQAFDKLNWQKYLLVRFNINRLPPLHIVDRYRMAAAPLGIKDDGEGLDYFIPPAQEVDVAAALPPGFRLGHYVAVAIGAQHATKRLPPEKLIELVQRLAPRPVVLLGGPEDESTGHVMELAFQNPSSLTSSPTQSPIYNGCGKFSLHQSASLLRQAKFVVSHDTGLMHIASAFKKQIFSVWGNTVPQFGMYPYRTRFEALEVLGLPCRPCSKIGFAQCPQGHFKCMREQDLARDWPG